MHMNIATCPWTSSINLHLIVGVKNKTVQKNFSLYYYSKIEMRYPDGNMMTKRKTKSIPFKNSTPKTNR